MNINQSRYDTSYQTTRMRRNLREFVKSGADHAGKFSSKKVRPREKVHHYHKGSSHHSAAACNCSKSSHPQEKKPKTEKMYAYYHQMEDKAVIELCRVGYKKITSLDGSLPEAIRLSKDIEKLLDKDQMADDRSRIDSITEEYGIQLSEIRRTTEDSKINYNKEKERMSGHTYQIVRYMYRFSDGTMREQKEQIIKGLNNRLVKLPEYR